MKQLALVAFGSLMLAVNPPAMAEESLWDKAVNQSKEWFEDGKDAVGAGAEKGGELVEDGVEGGTKLAKKGYDKGKDIAKDGYEAGKEKISKLLE